jgi:glutamyl-tRNA synthetase
MGYFPEAVVNMLALLGWNPGTEQELFTLSELVQLFDLNKVNKSGARFDPEKTNWFQHQYLQQKSPEELASLFKNYLEENNITMPDYLTKDGGKIVKIVALLKERATFITDFWEQGSFFFITPKEYTNKAAKKAFKEDTPEILNTIIALLTETEDFSTDALSTTIKNWITSNEISFGKVMMPLRLALVGDMKGPDVFEIMHVLGKDESLKRIKNAVAFTTN